MHTSLCCSSSGPLENTAIVAHHYYNYIMDCCLDVSVAARAMLYMVLPDWLCQLLRLRVMSMARAGQCKLACGPATLCAPTRTPHTARPLLQDIGKLQLALHYALEFHKLQQSQRRQQDLVQLEQWLLTLMLANTTAVLEEAGRASAERAATSVEQAARVAIYVCLLLDRRQVLFDQVRSRGQQLCV
jgi:hypothetical protein